MCVIFKHSQYCWLEVHLSNLFVQRTSPLKVYILRQRSINYAHTQSMRQPTLWFYVVYRKMHLIIDKPVGKPTRLYFYLLCKHTHTHTKRHIHVSTYEYKYLYKDGTAHAWPQRIIELSNDHN